MKKAQNISTIGQRRLVPFLLLLQSCWFNSRRIRNLLAAKTGLARRWYADDYVDRYIRKTFFPDYGYRGIMVEVGCATPELLSMSQHFRECQWRCIGIEPNPKFAKLHRDAGNEILEYAVANFSADDQDFTVVEASDEYGSHRLSAQSYSSLKIKPEFMGYKSAALQSFKQSKIKVSVRTLDAIVETHCPEVRKVDLLTVDVEGYEIEVMKGFSVAKYRPKVIVLENLFRNHEYAAYMNSVGYELDKSIGWNEIYVTSGK